MITPPMPDRGEHGTDDVDLARARVGHVAGSCRRPDSTTAITTASSAKPTRHDSAVVRKPPSSGPTAAAIADAAPTSAYACFCAAPSKLPWISACIDGSSSDAPSPPITAQKTMIAVRPCANVIAIAPIA